MKQFVTPLLFLAASSAAMASLISIGPVPESGTGLGAVNTVLTVQSPGSSTDESGCVGFVTNMTMTGSTACPGAPVFTGGNEQAQNHTYLSTDLGPLTTFANLQVIFNGNEPRGGGKESITLTDLALTLWGTDGTLLGSFQLGAPLTIPDVFPGIGNAGYGFVINPADNQLAEADAILAAHPSLYIGAAITAANAEGGIDTVSIRTVGGTGPGPAPVPEPGTLAMMGGGLMALAFGVRRRLS